MRTQYLDEKGQPFSLRKGKLISQGSHAAMAFIVGRIREQIEVPGKPQKVSIKLNGWETAWCGEIFTKVVLQAETEAELRYIVQLCGESGIENHLITDSGKTEFGGVPTVTALGIGPADSDAIDRITGPQGIHPLKLY